tara:strand:- start:656 stop:1486 length:831 start_codon:yes stop_codon:yes gene_type:complete
MSGLGLGIASLVTGVGTTAMSFAEKAKQENKARKAQAKADEMLSEARAKLQINFADALSIAKEPYERQREAMLSAGAQVMEQAVESERGAAATAGRVLAMQQEGQGQIRDQQSRDIFNLEAMQAEEDSRLRDVNAQLDLGEVEGAQLAAAASETAANVAEGQAIQGVANVVQQAIAMPKLYGNTKSSRAVNEMERLVKRGDYLDYNTAIMDTGNQYTVAQEGNVPQQTMYNWGEGNANQVNITGLVNAKSANEKRDWWNNQDLPFINWYAQNKLQK